MNNNLPHKQQTLSHNYDIKSLKVCQDIIKQAEDCLRNNAIERAIDKYIEVRNKIFYNDIVGAIYFNQKAINLAKRYNLDKSLIKAYISMGDCFNNTLNPENSILSMSFKEAAKRKVL